MRKMNVAYTPVKALYNQEIDDFLYRYDITTLKTPCHLLFLENFRQNIKNYIDVFYEFGMNNNIFFSCKANKSNCFIREASSCSCGIEVSSLYELLDALKYTSRIIASGPAKSEEYLLTALDNDVVISVDDIYELRQLASFKKKSRIMIRLSDLLDNKSRFGITVSLLDSCLEIIKNFPLIELIGFSFHINNYHLADRVHAIHKILDLVELKNIDIQYIDIGGGFPIEYCLQEDFNNFKNNLAPEIFFARKNLKEFYPYAGEISSSNALKEILVQVYKELNGIQIIIEPGRSLLNNCGITIFDVCYTKNLDGDYVVVTNGNINFLSEQWFDSDYLIEPILVQKKISENRKPVLASIAGNLCLEQDMLTWRKIMFDDIPSHGDKLVYLNTAGYQMDSNESSFHKIPLPPRYVVRRNPNYQIVEEAEYDSY